VVGKDQRGQTNIGYVSEAQGVVDYRTTFGALTTFAFFHEFDKGNITKRLLEQNSTLNISCGCVLYSELPKFYDLILGMTGTLDGLSKEESTILVDYGFDRLTYIPSTFQRKSLNIEDMVLIPKCDTRCSHFDSIKQDIKEKLEHGRGCLVVFETYSLLKDFGDDLKQTPIEHQHYEFPEILHQELTTQERDAVILRSVRQHKITLITRNYGRGTDFICRDDALVKSGGMHVILTFYPDIKTEEIQIKGRTCRQDDPGSFRAIIYWKDLENTVIPQLFHWTHYSSRHTTASECLRNKYVAKFWSELDEHSDDIDGFLSGKRKLMDSNRYKNMMKRMEESAKLYEETKRMAKCIQRNNEENALDVLVKMNEL